MDGMNMPRRRFAKGIVLTGTLLLLIAFAVGGDLGIGLAATMVGAAVAAVAYFSVAFPGSTFFSLALTNSIAVYVSMFVFLSEANFEGVAPAAQHAGFLLPLAALMVGAFLRRAEIRKVVGGSHVRSAAELRRSGWWLVPTLGVGVLTFAIPASGATGTALDLAFVAAMGAVAALVLLTVTNVVVFLVDAGLLFEEFFARLERLVIPVYAFLTFYSLIVVAFAAVYKIVDRMVPGPHFQMVGEPRAISFSDAIYFSVVTLSTVGYGDVLPITGAVRLIAVIEVIFGVTLLLVGFSEIMSYSREVEARRRGAPAAREETDA